jgi:hypothetical protein
MMNNVEEYQNLVSILKSALEFYGNKDNYDVKHPINNVLFSHIEMDCGAQAKFALGKIQEMENNHKMLESEYIKSMDLGITEEESAKNVQKMIEEFKTLTGENNNV